MIYDSGTRGEAAKLGGVTLQIVRDWVMRLNAEGPAGLIDRKASGSAPKLRAAERQALAQMIERGPNRCCRTSISRLMARGSRRGRR